MSQGVQHPRAQIPRNAAEMLFSQSGIERYRLPNWPFQPLRSTSKLAVTVSEIVRFSLGVVTGGSSKLAPTSRPTTSVTETVETAYACAANTNAAVTLMSGYTRADVSLLKMAPFPPRALVPILPRSGNRSI